MLLNIFQYDFIVRGLIAGVIIAVVAPVVGIFLVLRRYSLIADTLSHVSLAGIAIGFLLNINPLITATVSTIIASTFIEKLRNSKKLYGESALALFLSGSLALAIVLIGLSHGFNATLFNYLFGSIATVTTTDIITVFALALIVIIVIKIIYNQLLYLTFDQEAAVVSGINDNLVNTVFAVLAAATISLSIPIVGVLLISSLLIIPVLTALQFKKSLIPTILIAQGISIVAVILGSFVSFYLNLATGGTIVLITVVIFLLTNLLTS
jgi:zinc transport system permease protein